MTCQLGHISCVFTVGSHVANYYYNQTVIVKNALMLKLKIAIRVKNVISDTKELINKKVLKFMTVAIKKYEVEEFPNYLSGGGG